MLVKFDDKTLQWLALDYNNNQVLDDGDKYFYPDISGDFKMDIKLFANRIPVNLSPYNVRILYMILAKFTFFTQNNSKPTELMTLNKYNKKELILKYDEKIANGPSLNNIAIVKNDESKINILSGNIFLNEDLIIKSETKILEGTIFTMSEGASIVFENKVNAVGSSKKFKSK